ncbi:myocilin isoform X2 [Amblyraja radiata]|uniref:myocilin isoform X2 n=1 Tax=Amblyraja radiata TaxID=386614 RepID=UPI001402EAEB|nr:myocilin isoform X2 [Amblyraja radiata]
MEVTSLLAIACSLVLTACGQSPTFSRTSSRDGRCIYSFTVPSPAEESCSEPGEALRAVRELQRERAAQRGELVAMEQRLRLLEGRLAGREDASVAAGEEGKLRAEKADLLRRLEAAEQENARLRDSHCPGHRDSAQDSQHVARGGRQDFFNVPSRKRAQSGREASKWNFESTGYQELKSEIITEIPASKLASRSESGGTSQNPGCGMLEWVGEPVTFQKADSIVGRYGVWMKDPEPVPPHSREHIWRINTVGTDIRRLYEYQDLDQFMKGHTSKVYMLPEPVESTGATVYRGSLYYQKRKSRTLLRFEMKSETILVRKDLANAGYRGVFPYSWGGYTDIDFAVDELGLWVIYSTSQAYGAIVISKLDPNTLEVEQTWATAIRKRAVANSFIICGVLYTINSYSNQNAVINFAYNTNTNSSKALAIQFENRYRYNSMVDYNPAEKKILAWDNFNMVMYDIKLSKM